MLKRRGKTLKNQAELSWETGPLLKDRRKRKLSFEDVSHYQKIIIALTETDRLMGEIDGVEGLMETSDND